MGAGKQLLLLIWKNCPIQRTQIVFTIFMILYPVFYFVILVLLRYAIKTSDKSQPTIWGPVQNVTSFQPLQMCSPSCKLFYSPNHAETTQIMTALQKSITEISGKTFEIT